MKIGLLLLAATGLSGCAITPQNLSGLADMEVCQSYGVYRIAGWTDSATKMGGELEVRKLLKDDEWALVRRGTVRVGMSQCAMYAARGRPDRENRTVGSYGAHIQHVYGAGYRYIKATYIYTQNGVVTSFQD